jgi:hypothetical protein
MKIIAGQYTGNIRAPMPFFVRSACRARAMRVPRYSAKLGN